MYQKIEIRNVDGLYVAFDEEGEGVAGPCALKENLIEQLKKEGFFSDSFMIQDTTQGEKNGTESVDLPDGSLPSVRDTGRRASTGTKSRRNNKSSK